MSSICYDYNGNAYYCNSGWYTWGRWVALGVVLVLAILFFFLCSAYSARRRRRLGRQPYYGTGWATTPWGHGPAQYNPGYNSQQAPPAYRPQTENTGYYGENQGYFGGRQTDTEMQPPQNTYRGGDNVYQPPTGPPPGKSGDGIVR